MVLTEMRLIIYQEKMSQQMLENVKEGVDAFVKDAEQFDDLTMLAIEYKGKKLKKL